MDRLRTIGEVWGFLKVRKKYWLAPLLIALVLLSILIVAGESSGLGPLVYPFF